METLNLSVRIFIALILAVVVGLAVGEEYIGFINWWIAPIGTIFINLIKMMIVPVVFTSLVVGMTESSAAMMIITISVTCAPRARMAVNAS